MVIEEYPEVEGNGKQRVREEKLIADIIDRVKKECEEQGSGSKKVCKKQAIVDSWRCQKE